MPAEQYEQNLTLVQKIKSGVIIDVTTPDQARLAEDAGACAVAVLERNPADIKTAGGVARMSDPAFIRKIQNAVNIPVIAKVRIGHFVEARIAEAIEVDYIDESEMLSPADNSYHIDKNQFKTPFICGAKGLSEALRRIAEGAVAIRTKNEPGNGDISSTVRNLRIINSQIMKVMPPLNHNEVFQAAKELQVPLDLVNYVHANGKLPALMIAAGGITTPADAAMMMQLGAESVYVGTGIFKSANPAKRAAAIVKTLANFNDTLLLAELSAHLDRSAFDDNERQLKLFMTERDY